MKSVHRMPLLKRVAIDDAAGSKIEPKKSIGSYQISDYFLTNIDNSLPAVISRLAACDGISYNTICKSTDLNLGLTARGFTHIPKSVSGVSGIITNYANKIKLALKNEFIGLKSIDHKFSLTLDEWTSVKNRRYLNINVHAKNTFWNLGLCRV